MILKDRNSWIAVIFLMCIFSIPVITCVRGESVQEAVQANADEVLVGNGTAAGKIATGETENVPDSMAEENAGSQDGAGHNMTQTENSNMFLSWTRGFTAFQEKMNGFTEKLFLRNVFISANSELTRVMTAGTYMESTQVLLGKENWLFYKTQNDGYPIYDYMGINHFSEAELAAMADNLIRTRDYFKERGVDFIATTIPNKEIVYEEYMPDTIARVNLVSRGEQFAQYMQGNTDVKYVYPKEAFVQYKEKYPLFYKTDTHWNHIGAFVGVQELFKELYGNCEGPDTAVFKEGQMNFAGDLSVIAGVAEKYGIDTVYEFDASTADLKQKRNEKAIVVGDSFGGFLSVIARGYYEEVQWIDTDDFSVDMIEMYDADVVIWESVERLQEVFMQESLLD